MGRGKSVSTSGKIVSEEDMNITALDEAKGWFDTLLDAEWQGRRDREGVVRYRLAKKVGIPESYAFRLQYKFEQMTDIRGSAYRALMRAHRAYEDACQKHEAAAAAYASERQELEAQHAAHQSPNQAVD